MTAPALARFGGAEHPSDIPVNAARGPRVSRSPLLETLNATLGCEAADGVRCGGRRPSSFSFRVCVCARVCHALLCCISDRQLLHQAGTTVVVITGK